MGNQVEETLNNIHDELYNLVNSGLNAGAIINTTEKWMNIVNTEKDGVNYYTQNLYNRITNNVDSISEINTTYNDRLNETISNMTAELNSFNLD